MAEKRENSVLFSLRELKNIETERVAQEESEKQAAQEAARQAKLDAERRAREEEERKLREAAEAERRARDEIDMRDREHQFRLDEAERRARVEAQAKVDAERARIEAEAMAAHAAKKTHMKWVYAAVAVVLAAGGVGTYLYMQSQEAAKKAETARLNQLAAEQDAERYRVATERWQQELNAIVEEMDRIAKEDKVLLAKIEKANAAEAAEYRRQMQENATRRAEAEARRIAAEKRKPKKGVKCADPNDPLCGI